MLTYLQLEDFDTVLSHHDERLGARLNGEYLKQEWRFTKEKHSSKKMPKEIPPVDAEVRRKQVSPYSTEKRVCVGCLTQLKLTQTT